MVETQNNSSTVQTPRRQNSYTQNNAAASQQSNQAGQKTFKEPKEVKL